MFSETSGICEMYLLILNKLSDKIAQSNDYTSHGQKEQYIGKMVKVFTPSCFAAGLDIRIRVLYFLGDRNIKSGH